MLITTPFLQIAFQQSRTPTDQHTNRATNQQTNNPAIQLNNPTTHQPNNPTTQQQTDNQTTQQPNNPETRQPNNSRIQEPNNTTTQQPQKIEYLPKQKTHTHTHIHNKKTTPGPWAPVGDYVLGIIWKMKPSETFVDYISVTAHLKVQASFGGMCSGSDNATLNL